MKKILVIYHREDNDGVCSAGIVQAWLTRFPVINNTVFKPEEFEFYGVNYADLSADWDELVEWVRNPSNKKPRMAKWDKFEAVFMVDISFNSVEAMNHMYEAFDQNFHWCDHHHPIIKASETEEFRNAPGVRRTDQSALLNTWDYLADQWAIQSGVKTAMCVPSDYLVKLSDYDSWSYKSKPEYDSQEAEDALLSFNTGVTRKSNLKVKWFYEWVGALLDRKGLHNTMADDAFSYGCIVYQLDNERTERAIRTHGDTNWIIRTEDSDRKACAIITTDRFYSGSFKMFRGTDIVHGLVFKVDANNDKIIMSMYNVNEDEEFDCGAWLKENYAGGGHKGAAGCTLTRQQFMLMFETRIV